MPQVPLLRCWIQGLVLTACFSPLFTLTCLDEAQACQNMLRNAAVSLLLPTDSLWLRSTRFRLSVFEISPVVATCMLHSWSYRQRVVCFELFYFGWFSPSRVALFSLQKRSIRREAVSRCKSWVIIPIKYDPAKLVLAPNRTLTYTCYFSSSPTFFIIQLEGNIIAQQIIDCSVYHPVWAYKCRCRRQNVPAT
jgi:hypothetical protein